MLHTPTTDQQAPVIYTFSTLYISFVFLFLYKSSIRCCILQLQTSKHQSSIPSLPCTYHLFFYFYIKVQLGAAYSNYRPASTSHLYLLYPVNIILLFIKVQLGAAYSNYRPASTSHLHLRYPVNNILFLLLLLFFCLFVCLFFIKS